MNDEAIDEAMKGHQEAALRAAKSRAFAQGAVFTACQDAEDAVRAWEKLQTLVGAKHARAQRLESLEDLLRLATASAVAGVDARSCGTKRDWTKAAKAEEEYQAALGAFRDAL